MRLSSMVSVATFSLPQKVYTLSDELTFKLVKEFERELVFCGKCLLTNDSLHRRGVSGDGVLGILSRGHICEGSEPKRRLTLTSWLETSA